MTYTQQAIYKAIEGGFNLGAIGHKNQRYKFEGWSMYGERVEVHTIAERRGVAGNPEWAHLHWWIHIRQLVTYPTFWRALGKSEGWEEWSAKAIQYGEEGVTKADLNWKYHWHSLVDHLAEGNDIESFFKELLDNK